MAFMHNRNINRNKFVDFDAEQTAEMPRKIVFVRQQNNTAHAPMQWN